MENEHAVLSRGYPETSVRAEESIDAPRLELLVLETIQSFKDGCISDEVRRCHPNLAYSSVTARFASLYRKHLIHYKGERRGNSGRNQRVMFAEV